MNDRHVNACTCIVISLFIVIGGLTPLPAISADSSATRTDWDKTEWRRNLLEARTAKDVQMVSTPTSMLAAVAQVWHRDGEILFFDVTPTGINYSERRSPDSKIAMTLSGNHWEWHALDTTVSAIFRGRPIEPGRLEPGMRIDVLGRYRLVIWSGAKGDLQLGVFDSERPALKSFNGLVYYPPDDHYRLEAEFERHADPVTIKMQTNISDARDFISYGEIRFTIDGQRQRLTAFKERLDDSWLYIPFRDQTAGKTTYYAGRFLVADEPETGTFILDFNRAVNLSCAYSPGFHCPIPPRENWMQVIVAAGEQTYPLPD